MNKIVINIIQSHDKTFDIEGSIWNDKYKIKLIYGVGLYKRPMCSPNLVILGDMSLSKQTPIIQGKALLIQVSCTAEKGVGGAECPEVCR